MTVLSILSDAEVHAAFQNQGLIVFLDLHHVQGLAPEPYLIGFAVFLGGQGVGRHDDLVKGGPQEIPGDGFPRGGQVPRLDAEVRADAAGNGVGGLGPELIDSLILQKVKPPVVAGDRNAPALRSPAS